MVTFKSNQILSKAESIAEQLWNARHIKKLDLQTVSHDLNIDYKYLQALENGNYNKLPTGVYKKNFLKKYSFYLGLDYNNLVENFGTNNNSNHNEFPKTADKQINKHHNFFSQQVAKTRYFLSIPKIVKSIIVVIITCICFTYLDFYLKKTALPPELYILEPKDNLILKDNFFNIIGQTEPEAQVAVNGEMILTDNIGLFKKNISLKKGVNTIIITAKKKYGNEKIVKKQVLVQ